MSSRRCKLPLNVENFFKKYKVCINKNFLKKFINHLKYAEPSLGIRENTSDERWGKCKIEMYFLLNDHSLDCRKARKCAMNYCNFLNFA